MWCYEFVLKGKDVKMILRLSIIAFLLADMGVCSPCGAAIVGSTFTGPAELRFVEEWEKVSAEEANIAVMSKEQILAEVQKRLEAQKALDSWESRYRVTWRQRSIQDSIPEIMTKGQARIVSDRERWIFEGKEEHEYVSSGGKQILHYRFACNGETVTMLWPDDKSGQVKDAQEAISISGTASVADFMSWLPAASCLRQHSGFPEVFEILGDPCTQLLPWYTRVGGQTCYVLERTTTLRQPVFRNKKELESWKKENPEKAEAWSKAARYGLVFNIYPQGQPGGGDTRVMEMKFRLAIAPELGFTIVCWAYGKGSRSGAYRGFIFPDREIKYSDFRKVSKDLFIPYQMVYANYSIDRHGQRYVAKDTRLAVEEFTVNKRYQSKLFEFDFPKGYNLTDADKGIVYTVGDSKEKIDTLMAAAKARDAFYEKLSQTQAPSLEPNKWINSAPIVLTEQKGRPIILYFWSLGCAPCMYELPRLQEQYGRTVESFSSEPLFISIHPFVDGDYLKQLKDTVNKYGITFPVMVDSHDTEGRSWGKTFKKYRVFGIPTEVSIDENGHFAGIDKDLITTSSWWFKNLGGK